MTVMDEISELVKKEVSERRFLHSKAVAKMAGELARAHGFSERNVERAEEAGLIHDVAKEFSLERNREYIERYGLDKKLLGEEAKNYIHAEVGAEVAREMGLDEEQVAAVRHHTIPVRGMRKLEKIVFLSDKIGREKLSKELKGVRELAFMDLDKAMLMFLDLQEEELRERGIEHSKETKELMKELRRKND